MIKVTLGNGEIKEFDAPLSAFDAARELGEAKTACAAEIDGKVCDLRTTLTDGCTVKFLTFEDEQGQRAFNHTASHVLAQAVKRLFPATKLAIGPAIENGFYYDFDTEEPFTTDTLAKIEAEMKKIVKESIRLEHFTMAPDEAIKYLEEQGEPYKVELCQEHAGKGEPISFYKQGDFTDLCAGPHLMSTSPVKAFKLTSVTGAYWRGSEKNKMLTRIYGTCFEKKADLDEYIQKLEEAKLRDHNKVGREMGLFMTDENIGQGLPLIMPKGARIIQIMQRFVEDEEQKRGYLLTKTPIMTKNNLFITSGHWDHYKDKMFYIGDEDVDDEILCLRPMTCPFQFTIYKNGLKSYRDLPVRYAETAIEFRKEASGEMHGLTRIRQFTLSDGHIVCTPDQLESEFQGAVDLIKYLIGILGLQDDVSYRFSRWDPKDPDKYVGNAEDWDKVETAMQTILNDLHIDYTEAWGEAAFYGPKLDVQGKNVHGKEDTLFTVQIDFSLATRFDMIYIDENGEKARPLIIHRSSIGCYERTLAMLIEKYNGAFPMWLAPEQARVLSLTDRTADKAKEVRDKLFDLGLRAEADVRSEKLGKKIREAQLDKVPYIIVIGDKEAEQNVISVRHRSEGDLGTMTVEEFVAKALLEVATKEIK